MSHRGMVDDDRSRGPSVAFARRATGAQRTRLALAALGTVAMLVAVAPACSGDDPPAASGGPTTSGARPASDDPRPTPTGPNVVLVVLDDLDEITMPYWEAMPKTRRRLADRGVTYTNAFATSPECCPSRATLLTGRYPHTTGIYDSTPPDGGYDTFSTNGAEEDTVATRLHDAGYRTAFIGKYLNGYEQRGDAVPPGWDEWFGVADGFSKGYDFEANHNGETETYGSDPDDYLTDVLADRAREELDRAEDDDDRPFLLALWTSAPHDAIPPAPRHADNPFADAELPEGANFDEVDVDDKPTWLREGVRRLTPRDRDDLTRRYRMMMGSLYAVDDLVDGVLAQLEDDGELEDTLVVFTSDNGYNFGAHRLPHKMAPYEESIRVPLVISGPGFEHRTEDRLVLTNDVVPTILDAAGLDVDDLDGSPLAPLSDPAHGPWREDFLVEYHGTYHRLNSVHTLEDVRRIAPGRRAQPPDERQLAFVPTFRAVRSERWLYVEWYAGEEHEHELYDLAADPAQLQNLLATDEGARRHAATTGDLRERLEALGACAGPTCRP